MLSLITHQTTSKDAMIARFPPKIATIEGEITLKELLHVFRRLIVCAESTITTCDLLNFLYLVVSVPL